MHSNNVHHSNHQTHSYTVLIKLFDWYCVMSTSEPKRSFYCCCCCCYCNCRHATAATVTVTLVNVFTSFDSFIQFQMWIEDLKSNLRNPYNTKIQANEYKGVDSPVYVFGWFSFEEILLKSYQISFHNKFCMSNMRIKRNFIYSFRIILLSLRTLAHALWNGSK